MNFHIRVRAGALIIENHSVLLVEFEDEKGLHYNLPAGGAEPNESVPEAVRREVMEEASVDVNVGPLAFVYEYVPYLNEFKYGATHSLGLMFDCEIKDGHTPKLPSNPDENQTGVKWIPLNELNNIVLYPKIQKQILDYAENKKSIDIIQEHLLEESFEKPIAN
jgi:8-oxo-dGTP diphosphatase